MESSTQSNKIDEVTSLDPSDDVQMYFFFRVQNHELKANKLSGNLNSYKMYSISHKSACLIPFFNDMVLSSPNECSTEETSIPIIPIQILDDCLKNQVYWINTIQLFDIVIKYVKIWENNCKSAGYIKEDIIQTGNADQILKTDDLKLITEYIKSKLDQASEQDKKKIQESPTFKKYYIISSLNPLLKMVDGFLRMDCFANKLHAYIATILWKCTMLEITEVSGDSFFTELQENQINEWNHQNAKKLSITSKGDTVGEPDSALNHN
jgi:hypothetical protein